MSEITLNATVENIELAMKFVNEELEKINCSEDNIAIIDIAVDEIFGNIAKYAYQSEEGVAIVRFESFNNEKTVKISFIDEGIRYNPLEKEDPDITLSLEEREIGGLGVFIVKKSMDDMIYEYIDNKNTLTIIKNL